jgi:hypothetical protein
MDRYAGLRAEATSCPQAGIPDRVEDGCPHAALFHVREKKPAFAGARYFLLLGL